MGLRVIDPGLYTLVVDHGRPGFRSLGVPVSGAADRFSLAIGNALVGNPPGAAALEFSLAGPTVRADCELGCVVFGAPFALTSDQRRVPAGTTFTLAAGEELRVGATPSRMRGYFCVRGGFRTKPILDSASSLEPLKAGVTMCCTAGGVPSRFLSGAFAWDSEPKVLRVLEGSQASWFRGQALDSTEFRVTEASDRMGVRLDGEPLDVPQRELVSEPVSPGAVQALPDGQCVVLGVDGQTIGGYPKIAQVISADVDKVGQLRPGDRVKFKRVDLVEAEIVYRQKARETREWVTRLLVSLRG
jgi:5-oxoprolinase (ATP-hydrolysing) subunit C